MKCCMHWRSRDSYTVQGVAKYCMVYQDSLYTSAFDNYGNSSGQTKVPLRVCVCSVYCTKITALPNTKPVLYGEYKTSGTFDPCTKSTKLCIVGCKCWPE